MKGKGKLGKETINVFLDEKRHFTRRESKVYGVKIAR